MASIRENRKNGKVVSYRFTACLERDAKGKQIRKYLTWTPPDGLSPAKAKKVAEKEADRWEGEIREEYEKEKAANKKVKYSKNPEYKAFR